MSVQVIDVKTGKLKSMPVKHANILVKMKRARWPEKVAEVEKIHVPETEKEVETESDESPEELPEVPKKRGRKPKVQE
ncbi:TPA: hypothetical protein ACKQDM_005582 [Pseudomonas aeruginosa]|uniref:hypothetical protein n=1 Tax=Pseudomonas aeruginosa TaxID=287 RepID=UPI001CA7FFAD|nr:hypothetical protein [Pseudomonas aeruginosa]MBY9700613.1 hypothetical protein [Pseudomonas aeruginosa]MCT5733970.1 hypothetical protein [Pseudomonas aeruginosa]MCT5858518.1 hypothetical protein [Pseudomonas aeruginosa]MCT5924319.1 hypothetical protein [Pseudomonas aeruginosa]HCF5688183.1 hypothetical protein [Pseudomonas aeruginosa]